jgi:hypothetical protein
MIGGAHLFSPTALTALPRGKLNSKRASKIGGHREGDGAPCLDVICPRSMRYQKVLRDSGAGSILWILQ